ncbi:MAG: YhjD/YihY/BrkB family envelope integrity protein [Humidesulfovibrio sp.]|uniref:YhjD/YihY/BrkB family envelope integrity protein n=1 Tax=Humidesulfovibrio sp. TaxID=2910988 RepID=UPI002732412E|nr:YhjD/YihY/BrkB family envelope integrity protein [Humidesulfovibrio sp.]MDP2846970.1 YhjD/YihY/BrkB family envelope integrity protein [Humidesulfovibrio sp.]
MAGQGSKGVKGAVERHFRHDIWAKDAAEAGGARKGVFALSRLIYMVSTGFLADHCIIRASALTFTTILAIVPLLAVAFSISKGFGLQNAEFFRDFLMGVSAGRAEVVDKILQYIANTNVKTLGWIGVATLLLTVFTTVGNVERAFNSIWGVKKGRTSWRKFTDFFSVIVICPIIVLVAASFTVAVQKFDLVRDFVSNPGYDGLEKFLLKFISLALVWVGFTFVYAFVPNTRVRLKSAIVGGMVAGTLWQTAQWLYIHWQIGFTKYNAIYGSFAQLPLFLIWLYISWIIVLLGAEVSYAVQHLHAFVRRGLSARLSPLSRQKVAVAALTHIAARYAAGLSPLPVDALARALHLPEDVVMDTLAALADAGMAVPLGDEESRGYALAMAAENIRMAEVLEVLAVCGDSGDCGGMVIHPGVDPLFQTFSEALRQSPANVTLAEFAQSETAEMRTQAARARELAAIRERTAN